MSDLRAPSDVPICDVLATRFSPYSFTGDPVFDEDLRALFEAARWSPSSYNEQPWRFLVARRNDAAAFETMLRCLVEGNRTWAGHAPVLVLTAAVTKFARNGKPNRHAFHDVGLAAAFLTVEAASRGLAVHQMAGILPDVIRRTYALPDDVEPLTAIAIGKAGPNPQVPGELAARDAERRPRQAVENLVFQERWNMPARFGRG